jgi:leucyl aminopeptidase
VTIEFLTTAKLPDDGVEILGVPVCSDDVEGASEIVNLAFLVERGFEAAPGDALVLPGNGGTTVVALGVGPQTDVTPSVLRVAAVALARSGATARHLTTTLLDAVPAGGDRMGSAQAIAEGTRLGAYSFTRLKSGARPSPVETVTIVGTGGKRLHDAVERGARIAEAQCLARDLVNTPAGDLPPRALAEVATEIAEREGLILTVLDEVDIEAANLGALMGVARGSSEPARLIQLTYEPDKPRGTLALVGKGITFDSGGLSLKTAEGMLTMKTDMGGAAAVLGAMSAIRAVNPKVTVHAFVPAAENMTGASATKPGDVLRSRSGITIEVLNTDAEGRLALADALTLAVETQPDAIVDIATLTGACQIALGGSIAGLMGNNESLIDQVEDAAEAAGEEVWHLPLPEDYRRVLESEVADIRNVGVTKAGTFVRAGGALTAGLFLREFVGGVPWAHLDIAGPARSAEERGEHPVGGTGIGVRTLLALVAGFKKPK